MHYVGFATTDRPTHGTTSSGTQQRTLLLHDDQGRMLAGFRSTGPGKCATIVLEELHIVLGAQLVAVAGVLVGRAGWTMTAKSPVEVLGFEYDWLGSDGDGRVALFSTAGGSHAPEAFLQDTDVHKKAIDLVLASPPTSVALFAPTLKAGRINTWLEFARRGFFAFDGDSFGGPYRKEAAPKRPIHVDDLPSEVATVVRRLVFPRLRFAQLDRISSDALREGR